MQKVQNYTILKQISASAKIYIYEYEKKSSTIFFIALENSIFHRNIVGNGNPNYLYLYL